MALPHPMTSEAYQRERDGSAIHDAVRRFGARLYPVDAAHYNAPHLHADLRGDEITDLDVRVYASTRVDRVTVNGGTYTGDEMPPELYAAILAWVRKESERGE